MVERDHVAAFSLSVSPHMYISLSLSLSVFSIMPTNIITARHLVFEYRFTRSKMSELNEQDRHESVL
jgi:hypothetical protein